MTKEQILELTSRRIDNCLKALAERGFEVDERSLWIQDNPEYSSIEFGANDIADENTWYNVFIDLDEKDLNDQPYYMVKNYPPNREGYNLKTGVVEVE